MPSSSSSSSSGNPGLFPPLYVQYPAVDAINVIDESGSAEAGYSDESVRYGSGQAMFDQVDLESDGFGTEWGHTRSYTNALRNGGPGKWGNNWFVKEIPRLYFDPPSHATVAIGSISEPYWFNEFGGNYTSKFPFAVGLQSRSSTDDFSFIDAEGRMTLYYGGYTASRGQFKGIVDPKGNVSLAHYNGSNQLDYFEMGSSGSTARYEYAYFTTGANAGQLQSVTYKVSGTYVRRCVYAYYGTGDANGSVNDLKTAYVETYDPGSATWTTIKKSYYRYYKAGDAYGFASGLKYVVLPETYARMDGASIDPIGASDSLLDSWADYHYKYDSSKRVLDQVLNAGTQRHHFEYFTSAFTEANNNWKTKTVETLYDAGNNEISQNVVYTNYTGLPILKIRKSGSDEWYEYWQYDVQGVGSFQAESSAVDASSFDEGSATLIALKPSDGLVHVFEYFSNPSDPGYAPGMLKWEGVQKGSGGSVTLLRSYEYVTRTVGTYAIYPIAKQTEYRSEASGGSDPAETSFGYTWYSGSFQIEQKTTTWPEIATGENGSGTANSRVEAFDQYGRLTWLKDERGTIGYTGYDVATGALVKRIDDVNTSAAGNPTAPSGWSASGLNLITDYEFDLLGRETQELGPTHAIDLSGTSTSLRTAKWSVYRDDLDELWEGMGYATGTSLGYTYTLINPVGITRKDKADRVTDEIQAKSTVSGKLTAADNFPQSSRTRWKQRSYDTIGNALTERVYFLIPSSGSGSAGTNYDEAATAYDTMNRAVRVQSPAGTITRTVYNPQSWVLETWLGTNDTVGVGYNMKQVIANVYDFGYAKGDGNLTQSTQYAADGDPRVTSFGYDDRNRKIFADGEIDFYEQYAYDNLDRVIQTERRDTSSSGHRISKNTVSFDALGRVYRTVEYGVDPATGTVGNGLASNQWYDPSGNVVKVQKPGSQLFVKTVYDGLGRKTADYSAYDLAETAYPYPVSLSSDTVMQQAEYAYDDAGNLLSQTSRERFHNASGTGALTTPGGSQPKARVSYAASWTDALGRLVAAANYGTNGAATSPSWSRPATVPTRSDTVLVTTTAWNDRGEAWQATDPLATVNRSTFDDAGRVTQLLENYISGGTDPDENRQTDYAYHANGQLSTLTAKNGATGDQVTQFIYGTTLGNSDVASNELLRQKISPDDTGLAPDRITNAYNRLGQIKTLTDANGTVHDYDYDKLGRLAQDRVTTLGTGVNGTIRRIGRTYEVRGMLEKVSSYNNATVGSGAVISEVQFVYDSFRQLLTEYQAPSGTVVTATTPKVQYAYADGSANTIRRTGLTYPNGRAIAYDYDISGSMSDALSRISVIKESFNIYTVYFYLGLAVPVVVDYVGANVLMTLIGSGGGDAGDQYNGLDRFGRVVDTHWIRNGTTDIERIQYGYDRASNQKWRQNLVQTTGQDQFYTNDGLYQIKSLDRGTLDSGRTGLTGTPVWEEDFTYDRTGNWGGYETKVGGTTSLSQEREHNQSNEITSLDSTSGSSSSSGTTLVAYDPAGNMTKAPRPGGWFSAYDLVYDAWNRLVEVKIGSSPVGNYAYDGLNRRTLAGAYGTQGRYLFYSDQWQVLEERNDSIVSTSGRSYLWGLRGMDDLVLRDAISGGSSSSSSSSSSSGTSGRLYALGDTLSITAIVNTSGTVLERYGYDAFGKVSVMDAGFSPRSSSGYDWETLFCAYRYDGVTGFYQVRNRYLHPTLGRWLSRDPLPNAEMQDGANLYAYVKNSPVDSSDELGLKQKIHFNGLNFHEKKVAKRAIKQALKMAIKAYSILSKMTVSDARENNFYRKWFGKPNHIRLEFITKKFAETIKLMKSDLFIRKGGHKGASGSENAFSNPINIGKDGQFSGAILRNGFFEDLKESTNSSSQATAFLHEMMHTAYSRVNSWKKPTVGDFQSIDEAEIYDPVTKLKQRIYGVRLATYAAKKNPNLTAINADSFALFATDVTHRRLPDF